MKKNNLDIFNESIAAMNNLGLKMDSIMVSDGKEILQHIFDEGSGRMNIRSISKPITCLCVGIAIKMGLFSDGVEENVFKYFENYNIRSETNRTYLQKTKIKHLLTLTLGQEDRILNSNQMSSLLGKDICEYALNYPILHEPGEYFLYTNSPSYMLSVMIQKITGMKLLDFAKEHLFTPMGISDITWKESEQGYNMGCTGIEINIEDFHKIGILLRDDGIYEGNQIVPANWVKDMKTLKVKTPSMYKPTRTLPKYGYGYNLWICKNGIYYCDGTDGQYLIVVPKKNLVITTMGRQEDMTPITACMKGYFVN